MKNDNRKLLEDAKPETTRMAFGFFDFVVFAILLGVACLMLRIGYLALHQESLVGMPDIKVDLSR